MTKNTDKYTRNYSNFGNYPQPGKNLPAYYDYLKDAGDGSPGLQYMIQKAMGAYGNYHVIEGCEPTIDGTDITGSTGYVMWDGSIIKVASESPHSLDDGDYLLINEDGGYGTTGAKPTGVIIAERIGSTIYNIAKREDINSKGYFPYGFKSYGDIEARAAVTTYANINGNLDDISGFDAISSNTGIFQDIKGFSDINMQDNLDFKDTYHLKGVSQVTGISGIISDLLINKTPGTDDHAAKRVNLYHGNHGSSVLLHENNTERTTTEFLYTKVKEVIVKDYLSGCTVEWQHKHGGDGSPPRLVNSRLYINGSAYGSEYSTGSLIYVTVSTNVSGLIKFNDLIQIYAARGGGGGTAYVKNMKIYQDIGVNNDP